MKKKCLRLLVLFLILFSCNQALASGASTSSSAGEAQGESLSWMEREWQEYQERKRLERLKEEARQDTLDKLRRAYEPKPKEYFENTVCSFGPQFREISKRTTDEWYMFTPIDLSEDGKQTFDLIAGNMFVIGEVTVTVDNGRFQVDYQYRSSKIRIGREYFQIFPDYESIRPENLDNLHAQKRFSYGRAYSIADKLGGDTEVILFVCNTATFQKTTPGIAEYYSTNPDRVAAREEMLQMIGQADK